MNPCPHCGSWDRHLFACRLYNPKDDVVNAAEKTYLAAFRYWRGLKNISAGALEDQVVRAFQGGLALGIKIGKGEL